MTSHEGTGQPGSDLVARALDGLALRSIGPAFMGGRIADLAIHPAKPNRWFVAVGSGGVWRSDDAGISWTPLFDDQESYSIGCVRIDPSDPHRVWVGTGEAVSGRHVGWGDGVYRSDDGGASWHHCGLAWSEHISDILVDPRDGATVYVAAEGPLWSTGGERGLYKTVDGGATWQRVLHVDDDTGVTSAVFAPDDPDTIIAATYQRRRRVWSFVGGGPGSGVHRSTDGGVTWHHVTSGLPSGEMGRIGLAATPADPDLVYATIEAAEDDKGFYRSRDRGRTWEKRNSYISGGTGPHYYQELFASPSDPDRVYQVDVFLQVTTDGGATFRNAEDGRAKHSDNHVVWIDPDDDRHLIVGCDAGLYETHDEGTHWRHVSNLPIAQFYRVAVDSHVPFANVLGGAQDLGTLHGPIATPNVDGIRNQDWSVVLGADGYHAAFDPDDDDVSYVSWQVGNVMRHNRRTMELVDIQPIGGLDEPPERWNWDAPLITSRHGRGRVYMASQRVWRSDDRGDSWSPISPDLTGAANRYERAVGATVVSVDSLYDHMAMSDFATITALAESPLVDGLLYAGTDDGRVQVSEDGGATWREAAGLDEMPEHAFVNDIEPSAHDADRVIVVFDDHKSGDYTPYVFESADRGRTWTSLRGDLPENTIAWAIEQDHVNPDVLYLGAERGLHVSLDHGDSWHRLTKDVPTIAFRDLAVQRSGDDLVGATFGRGFYVLDDLSVLRALADGAVTDGISLLPVRNAWWYMPHTKAQAAGQPTLGSTAFRAANPPFGALITLFLAEDLVGAKEARNARERTMADDGEDVPFPGWDTLRDERTSAGPALRIVVRDAAGAAIRSLDGPSSAGLHRLAWDLRGEANEPVDLREPGFRAPWDEPARGQLVPPGVYSIEIERHENGVAHVAAGPESFEVIPLPNRTEAHEAGTFDTAAFRAQVTDLSRRSTGARARLDGVDTRIKHLEAGSAVTPQADGVPERLHAARRVATELRDHLTGDGVRARLEEPVGRSLLGDIGRVAGHLRDTTAPPTATQRRVVAETEARLAEFEQDLGDLVDELGGLSRALDDAGGPWTPR